MLAGTAGHLRQPPALPLGQYVRPSCPPTWTAAPAPRWRAQALRGLPRRRHLTALSLPCRLRHPGQLHLDTFASLAAAGFTQLCAATRTCVPELGRADGLDGLGDRLMFRAGLPQLRRRPRGAGGQLQRAVPAAWPASAGSRFSNVTSGAPETSSRRAPTSPTPPGAGWAARPWTSSGDMALGYSASSSTYLPADPLRRAAGRRPAQHAGPGRGHAVRRHAARQTGSGNRWGDYSDMTVDPVDDCTFWYTRSTTQHAPARSTGARASATSSSPPVCRPPPRRPAPLRRRRRPPAARRTWSATPASRAAIFNGWTV